MSLIDRALERVGIMRTRRADALLDMALKRMATGVHSSGWGGAWGEPPPPAVTATPNLYAMSGAVFSSVNEIADRVASTAYRTFTTDDEGEEIETKDGEPLRLLADPNPFMTRFSLFNHTAKDILLNGNAYWFLAGPDAGPRAYQPTQIWRMHPQHVRVVAGGEDGFISGYVYEVDGKVMPLDLDEVIHFPWPNVFSPYYGLSHLVAAALPAQTNYDMGTWNRNFFARDNAVPAGIVNIQDFVSDADYERIKTEWRETYGGRSRKTAFLRGGAVTYETMGVNQRDLDFVAGLNWSVREVYATFRTLHLLGEGDAKVEERKFLEGMLYPFLQFVGETISDKLLPFFAPRRNPRAIVGRFDDVRPRERALELEESRARFTAMSLDEVRKAQGLEPLGPENGGSVMYANFVAGKFTLPFEQDFVAAVAMPAFSFGSANNADSTNEDDRPATAGEMADGRSERRESRGDEIGDEIGGYADKAIFADPLNIAKELKQWERWATSRVAGHLSGGLTPITSLAP